MRKVFYIRYCIWFTCTPDRGVHKQNSSFGSALPPTVCIPLLCVSHPPRKPASCATPSSSALLPPNNKHLSLSAAQTQAPAAGEAPSCPSVLLSARDPWLARCLPTNQLHAAYSIPRKKHTLHPSTRAAEVVVQLNTPLDSSTSTTAAQRCSKPSGSLGPAGW